MATLPKDDDDDKEEKETLSAIVKDVHSDLRSKLASGISLEELWSSHVGNKETLTTYSRAMHSLAIGPWKKNHGGGRIQWCVDACKEYFHEGMLERLLKKDVRRFAYGNPTQLEPDSLPHDNDGVLGIVAGFLNRQLRLLDVGSCYNPFSDYKEFEVTAIDIAPAVKDVLECDFLKVPIGARGPSVSNGVLECITKNSYDIVVFSLLLSYFPSTEQRLLCCINAHQVLSLHGILLVITADSSHQNKHVDMMRSWCNAIENVGFHRWKYVKDVHLHCMGFRKTKTNVDYSSILKSELHSKLFIIQDK